MKKIIQKSLAVGAIAATGLATAASGAFAQAAPADATVNFTGTVGSVCIFSNMVNGVLEYNGFSLEAEPSPPGGLSTPGFVDLDCTGAVEVSVSLPQENGSTTDLLSSATRYGAAVFTDSNGGPGPLVDAFNEVFNGSQNSSTSGFVPGPFSETLEVSMYLEPSDGAPAGAYNYNVIVTATPQ